MTFDAILIWITCAILFYFLLLTVWYSLLLVLSFPEVLSKFRESKFGNVLRMLNRGNLLPLTIITPAFNEETRILNMVYSVMKSDYKNVRLIIINDGSTDRTMDILIKEFELYEVPNITREIIKTSTIKRCFYSRRFQNLTVLDKEHYSFHCAADAVNAGLNACRTPIVLTVDADTLLEPEALTRILFTFLSRNHCIAVSGSIYVLNGSRVEQGELLEVRWPKEYIAAVQSVEYLRSFLYGRAGLNQLNGSMCYPGAFTLFDTDVLRQVGGYDSKNFSYDAEIITKLHQWAIKNRLPYNMNHTPNAFSWTIVPNNLKSFWGQRNKWQRGMLRSVQKHLAMFLNPRYGLVGLITFPAYFIFEVCGPAIEFASYLIFIFFYLIGRWSFEAVFWFILLAWGYIAFLSVAMFFLNLISFNKYHRPGDALKILFLVFCDMLWFRQYRACCCFFASFHYIFNRLRGKPL